MGLTTRGIAVIASATLLAGCGGEDDFANKPRPPAPIQVSAALIRDQLTVSPNEFGAGLTTFIITNQSNRPRRLRLETDEIGGKLPGLQAETREIAPGGTTSLKVDLRQGDYRLAVVDGDASAPLDVGPKRPSAQDQLLLP